jgi:hypothetical protein
MQTLAVEGGLPYRQATAGVLLGWARSAIGEPAAGCGDLEVALARYRQTGAASELPYFLILYADAARMAGFNEVGQRALDEAYTLPRFRPSCVRAEIEYLGAALLISPERSQQLSSSASAPPWRSHVTAEHWHSKCARPPTCAAWS